MSAHQIKPVDAVDKSPASRFGASCAFNLHILTKEHLKEVYEKYHPLENELQFDVYLREQKVIKRELQVGQVLVRKK